MKNKYIVEDLETGKYLGNKYYIGGKQEDFFTEAYKFSAFELKLASMTILRPKERYRVYLVEVKDE